MPGWVSTSSAVPGAQRDGLVVPAVGAVPAVGRGRGVVRLVRLVRLVRDLGSLRLVQDLRHLRHLRRPRNAGRSRYTCMCRFA